MVTNINQAYRCSTITLTVSVLLPKDVKVTISVNRDAQTLYNYMNRDAQTLYNYMNRDVQILYNYMNRDAQTFYNYFVSLHNKSTRTKKTYLH